MSRLRRKLRRMPEEATAALRREVEEAGQLVHFEQLRNVPRNDGDLASALSYKVGRDGLSVRVGLIGKRALKKGFYARFLEFGTRYMRARPFLFPAIERKRKQIVRRFRHATDRALERVARGF